MQDTHRVFYLHVTVLSDQKQNFTVWHVIIRKFFITYIIKIVLWQVLPRLLSNTLGTFEQRKSENKLQVFMLYFWYFTVF